MKSRARAFAAVAIFGLGASPVAAQAPPPIIDMHLHALPLSEFGGGMSVCTNDQEVTFPGADPSRPMTLDRIMKCASPRPSPTTDEAVMRESLAMLRRYNVWAVTAGPLDAVSAWRAAEPDRILPAVSFAGRTPPSPAELRRLHADGRFVVFAEIGAQYRGRSLDDPSFEPYFALAEELDIPVGVHLGQGPPGAPYLGYSTYRARLTSPFQLEEVLIRHPRLRLYVMHYGSPLVDEMIALLYSHPQVYVDVAQNNWGFPRAHFYDELRRLVDAGFGERILFGSDQMVWPETIRLAIETIEAAPFLSQLQKRDIFYGNAARFLRLTPAEVARHHAGR